MITKLIIDRFENEYAVCEIEGEIINLKKSLLPSNAKEGDVIKVSFEIDQDETTRRKEKTKEKLKDLFDH
ncbi:MAG: DUF3006 domain-containing protein [Clostridiaceae bacterium]|nr:DUF3006 domain-containing protein [Clostridiaceae bacterium]